MFQDTKPEGTTPEKETKIDIASILTLQENIKALQSNTTGLLDSILKSFQTLDQFTASVAKSFAGANQFAGAIRQNIIDATPAVTELGGSMEVVQKMQLGVMKNLSTQTLINSDSFAELYSNTSLVSEAGADIGEQTGKVVKSFADAGYGLYSTSKEMLGVINTARELGVQTNAVFRQVQENMGRLNTFNFADGIQGMAKMAANAALLRIDMKTTLGLADQLYDPEKAIEMAGTFQRMGVQVAELLDPYKLMDMARNDPAKLQESVGKALAQYTYFDGERTRIMAGGMDILRNISKETGLNLEQITQWGISYSDLTRKMKEVPISAAFDTNEEDRKMIAGMAQLATTGEFKGQYVVTMQNKEGDPVTKLVSKLESSDREMLEQMQKPAKTAIELQHDSLSELSRIYNALQAQTNILALGLITNPKFNMGMRKFLGLYEALAKTQGEIVGLKREPVGEGKPELFKTTGLKEGIETVVSGASAAFHDAINKGDYGMAMVRLKGITDVLTEKGVKKVKELPETVQKNLETSGFSKEEAETGKDYIEKAIDFIKGQAKDVTIPGAENLRNFETQITDYINKHEDLKKALNSAKEAFNGVTTEVKAYEEYLKTHRLNPMAGKETPSMSLTDVTMKALSEYQEKLKTQGTPKTKTVIEKKEEEELKSIITPTGFEQLRDLASSMSQTLATQKASPLETSTPKLSVAPVTSVSPEIEKIVSSKFYGENINKNIEEKKTTVDLNINTNPPTLKQDMLNAIMMDPQLRELLTNTVKQEMTEETKKIGGIPK